MAGPEPQRQVAPHTARGGNVPPRVPKPRNGEMRLSESLRAVQRQTNPVSRDTGPGTRMTDDFRAAPLSAKTLARGFYPI